MIDFIKAKAGTLWQLNPEVACSSTREPCVSVAMFYLRKPLLNPQHLENYSWVNFDHSCPVLKLGNKKVVTTEATTKRKFFLYNVLAITKNNKRTMSAWIDKKTTKHLIPYQEPVNE